MVLAGEKAAKKISKRPVWIKDHASAHQVTNGAGELTTDPTKVVDTSMTVTARKIFHQEPHYQAHGRNTGHGNVRPMRILPALLA